MRPLIAETVYKNLTQLTHPLVNYLNENLSKANVIPDEVLPENIITLNSTVEYISEPFTRPIKLRIVLPQHEDLSKRKVSILAPISRALLGFKESDELTVKISSGYKKVKILKVIN